MDEQHLGPQHLDPQPLDPQPLDPQPLDPQQRSASWTGSWILLVVGLAVNVAGSLGFLPLAVGVVGGLTVAVAVAGLVRYRRRTPTGP